MEILLQEEFRRQMANQNATAQQKARKSDAINTSNAADSESANAPRQTQGSNDGGTNNEAEHHVNVPLRQNDSSNTPTSDGVISATRNRPAPSSDQAPTAFDTATPSQQMPEDIAVSGPRSASFHSNLPKPQAQIVRPQLPPQSLPGPPPSHPTPWTIQNQARYATSACTCDECKYSSQVGAANSLSNGPMVANVIPPPTNGLPGLLPKNTLTSSNHGFITISGKSTLVSFVFTYMDNRDQLAVVNKSSVLLYRFTSYGAAPIPQNLDLHLMWRYLFRDTGIQCPQLSMEIPLHNASPIEVSIRDNQELQDGALMVVEIGLSQGQPLILINIYVRRRPGSKENESQSVQIQPSTRKRRISRSVSPLSVS